MTQTWMDHLGFNLEGLIYLIGILFTAGSLFAGFFFSKIAGIICYILGIAGIIIAIVMNFKEESHPGIKITGIVLKFIVLLILGGLGAIVFLI